MNGEELLIHEQLAKLPANIRQAIESVGWRNVLQEISKELNIQEKNSPDIERETMLIVYGFVNPADYIENLIKEASIEEELAINIAEQVNNRIFGAIAKRAGEEVQEIAKSEPIIITPENKEVAVEELNKQSAAKEDHEPRGIQAIHHDLPMVEPSETAHPVISQAETPSVKQEPTEEQPFKVNLNTSTAKIDTPKLEIPTPNYSYKPGQDPYREPLK